jgi:DNA replication protein DnaC
METNDLNHLGAGYIIQNLMIHSLSPHARRLTEQMYTCNPFSIDIKLDDDSSKLFLSFMYKSDVLIIDGIGFELGRNANKFSQRQLENTIKKRDNACTPTILTSTLKLPEIKEIYGQDVYDFIISGMVIEAYPIKGDYF